MKNNKNIIISTIVILAVAIGLFFGYKTYQNSQIQVGSKTISVVVIDDRNSVKEELTHKTDAEMLGIALDEMELIGTDDSEFGRYVTTVSGIHADMAKTEWWKFTINGQDSVSGVDTTPIKDGDKIEFIFTIGW